MKIKPRSAVGKLVHYFRYEFREIAWPSSLPDPPSVAAKRRRKLTVREHAQVWTAAVRSYAESWRRVPRIARTQEERLQTEKAEEEKGPTLMEDLAMAARAGATGVKPALQRIYMTRALAYRDALQQFVKGYQEGLSQVMEKESRSQKEEGQKEGR